MQNLSNYERELVALGVVMSSKYVPCVENDVPLARKAGLSDEQIKQAIQPADRFRLSPPCNLLTWRIGCSVRSG